MADTIHERIWVERKAALPEARHVRDFRDYARGRQLVPLNEHQKLVLSGVLGNLFCDNVCKKVLTEIRNRLKLARYEIDDVTTSRDEILKFLLDVWVRNKVPSLSSSVHWATLRDGNNAVGINWVDGRPVLTRERWWNNISGFFMAYDENDQPTYAVRDWRTGQKMLRTVWFPDRIERYEQGGNGWTQRSLPGDNGWPVKWVDKFDKPLGIPFVHFANLQVPNDGAGRDIIPQQHQLDQDYNVGYWSVEPDPHYGTSELDGGFLGLQDQLNDVHLDITGAARYAGFPMFSATGITASEGGKKEDYTPEPGVAFTDVNKDAEFKMIQPGSLQELERTLKIKLEAVARQSGIPFYLISGNWPSGAALMRVEMPFIDKIDSIATSLGPAWSSVAHKCIVLSNAFGGTNFNPDALVRTVFESAFKRDPLTLASVAEKIAPFVSLKQVHRLLGLSTTESANIMNEIEEEMKKGIIRPMPGGGGATNPNGKGVPENTGGDNLPTGGQG